MSGPLGKYAQIVAAAVAVGTIGAAIVSRFIGPPGGDPFLDNLALIAMGAIFGASAATNGSVKPSLDALHRRVDALDPPGETPGETP